jgi:hypothetical protein
MGYFIKKRSFIKDFRIIFLREKIGFKRNYLKRQGTRGEHSSITGLSQVSVGSGSEGVRQRCDRLAQWKMGHSAGMVREGEMRRGKKSRLATGTLAQRAKVIKKRVSNLHNLSFK